MDGAVDAVDAREGVRLGRPGVHEHDLVGTDPDIESLSLSLSWVSVLVSGPFLWTISRAFLSAARGGGGNRNLLLSFISAMMASTIVSDAGPEEWGALDVET